MSPSEILKRAESLFSHLSKCDICPRGCSIDRFKYRGVCGVDSRLFISNAILHFGEEPPLVKNGGSGTVFFTGCPMKCIYCQNMGFSQMGMGVELSIEELAFVFNELEKAGAENLNLVTASHYVPHVLKALSHAVSNGFDLPVVYNTSSYESVETLRYLRGIVDVYLADLRYSDNESGLKYSRVPDYWDVAREALKEMYDQVGPFDGVKGLIVRVLVLPGRVTDHKKALDFIAYELSKNVPVSIMRQFIPVFGARDDEKLSRPLRDEEYEEILEHADELGLSGWYQLDIRQKVKTKPVESIKKMIDSKRVIIPRKGGRKCTR